MTFKNPIRFLGWAALMATGLSACSGSVSQIADRAPDYRSAQQENPLVIPPNLSAFTDPTAADALTIPPPLPDPAARYTPQRDAQGFIRVLPPLPGIQVIDTPNQTARIIVDADADKLWPQIAQFWQNQGFDIAQNEPQIGLMTTSWRQDRSDLPQTGFAAALNRYLGTISDNGVRDRYTTRLNRLDNGQTQIVVLYGQAQEHPDGDPKDPQGWVWRGNNHQNPVFQLEMTRRLALYLATHPVSSASSVKNSVNSSAAAVSAGDMPTAHAHDFSAGKSLSAAGKLSSPAGKSSDTVGK